MSSDADIRLYSIYSSSNIQYLQLSNHVVLILLACMNNIIIHRNTICKLQYSCLLNAEQLFCFVHENTSFHWNSAEIPQHRENYKNNFRLSHGRETGVQDKIVSKLLVIWLTFCFFMHLNQIKSWMKCILTLLVA